MAKAEVTVHLDAYDLEGEFTEEDLREIEEMTKDAIAQAQWNATIAVKAKRA